jgi:hypothetical protein
LRWGARNIDGLDDPSKSTQTGAHKNQIKINIQKTSHSVNRLVVPYDAGLPEALQESKLTPFVVLKPKPDGFVV